MTHLRNRSWPVVAILLIVSSILPVQASAQGGISATGGIVGQGGIQIGSPPPSQTAPAVSVDPASAVTLEGRAVNAITGEPLPRVNVTVTIFQTGPRPAAGASPVRPATFSAVTAAQGKFKFDALPPGRYQLTADRTGYVRANYGAEPGRPLKQVAGDPGQKIADIDFKLTPQAIIAGKVVDENGEPVANAPVRVLRLAGYFRQISGGGGGVNTNAIGEFLMGGLAPGRYVLLVDYRPGRFGPAAMATGQSGTDTYVPTYYPDATDPKAAGSISLNAGQEVRGIDVWLQKGKLYRIGGQVAGISTAQPDRVQVSLSPEGGPYGAMPTFFGPPSSERDGKFVYNAIQPGSYVLTATLYSNNTRPQTIGYATVVITDKDVDDVVIQGRFAAPVLISGTVKIEGAEDSRIANEVRLEPLGNVSSPGPGPGRIQEDKTFAIENVPLGKYNVIVMPLSEGYVKSISAGGADVLANGLDLSQLQALPPLEIVIGSQAGTVEGIIKEGEAMRQGAFITLLPDPLQGQPQRLRRSATADAGGHFSMKGVPPGSYRLYAWQETFPVRSIEPADLTPYESYSVSVKVDEGDHAQVELQIAKPQ